MRYNKKETILVICYRRKNDVKPNKIICRLICKVRLDNFCFLQCDQLHQDIIFKFSVVLCIGQLSGVVVRVLTSNL